MLKPNLLVVPVFLVLLRTTSIFAQPTRGFDVPREAWSIVKMDPSVWTRQKARPLQPRVKFSTELRLGAFQFDSPDITIISADNQIQTENSVFVSPLDENVVLNSNNSWNWPQGNSYGVSRFISVNGGTNWNGSIQDPIGISFADPAAAIDRNGYFYINYVAINFGQGLARSTNSGGTWTHTQITPNPGGLADKNHFWVDNSEISPHLGNLYAAWTDFGGSNNLQIVSSRSLNQGTTWSSGIPISNGVSAGSHNQGVNIQTAPGGEVYAVWAIYDSFPADEVSLGFAKSSNGGLSWGTSVRIGPTIKGTRSSRLLGGQDYEGK